MCKQTSKKFLISIYIIIFVLTFLSGNLFYHLNIVQAEDQMPPKTQKIVSITESIPTTARPGVYWYQLDDGSFNADHSDGKVTNVGMMGNCEVPFPKEKEIPDNIDFSKWPAEQWKDVKGISIPLTGINKGTIKLKELSYNKVSSYSFTGTPKKTSNTNADILTTTGGNHKITLSHEFMKRANGCPKMNIMYETPIDIIWQAEVSEEKEIDVTPDAKIEVGDTQQMEAKIRTKPYGSQTWTDYVSVTSRTDELKWWSSDESIATVNPTTGLVTAVSEGKVTIRAIWKKEEYLISDTAEVIVGEGGARIAIDLPNEICTTDTSTIQAEATLTKMDETTYSLQSHPSLSWASSDSSIATIGKNGVLTSTGTIGSTEITAHFVDTEQALDVQDTFTVQVVDCNGSEEPDAGVICTIPAVSNTLHPAYIDPTPTGVIKADKRDQETFDVAQGIPTSEDLYGNVLSREYLYDATFTQMTGTCDFKVPVTKVYHRKWDAGKYKERSNGNRYWDSDWKSDDKKVTKNYTITRPYAYWTIPSLAMYQLSQAELANYALPNGKITLTPNGYRPPSYQAEYTGGFTKPESVKADAPSSSLNGGRQKSAPSVPTEDLSLFAEKEVPDIQVHNDKLIVVGQLIMDAQEKTVSTPTPTSMPTPTMIGRNVLYKSGNRIEKTKVNRKDTQSTGTVFYTIMEGGKGNYTPIQKPIQGINTVTVHTPVVNYSLVADDQSHNQKTIPDLYRSALILDRPFSVRIPTSGQHTNYPGYGNRYYAKYMRTKQVQFPFDVYNNEQTTFIPKHTWIDIPINQLDTSFFLPVWVDEGKYDILFRTIAENAPAAFTVQHNANVTLDNHVAVESVPVDVIGRVYDFHITDIADYNWQIVFAPWKNLDIPQSASYWVGDKGIDGETRGTTAPYMLPVRQGSHPIYRNLAVKTGYHFKFDLKTKGNMFGAQDSIRITPSFSYVSRQGGKPFPVDLYYSNASENFIQIGSAQDQVQRYTILNDPLRKVPAEELQNTALYMYDRLLQQSTEPISSSESNGSIVDQQQSNHFWTALIERVAESIWVNQTGISWEITAEQIQAITQKLSHSNNNTDTPASFTQHTTKSLPANSEEAIAMFADASAKRKVNIGKFTQLLLTQPLRTLIGPQQHLPEGNNTMRSLAAVQKWYGEYSLPADVYVVKQGTRLQDVTGSTSTNRSNNPSLTTESKHSSISAINTPKGLDDHSSIFLSDGYIVVNFNIETIQNGDLEHPHLQYIHAPLMNQWQLEGFQKQFNDPWGFTFELQDGDVIFYHANKGSKDDFQSSVTH